MATNIVMADGPIQVDPHSLSEQGHEEHWIGITYHDRHGKEQYLAIFGTSAQLQQIAITIRTSISDVWHHFPKAFRCRCGADVEYGWLRGNQVRCMTCYQSEMQEQPE